MNRSGSRSIALAVCLLAVAACTSSARDDQADSAPVVQLGAPGESNQTLTEDEAGRLTAPPHTRADVEFVQGMIAHHQQALVMTALVPGHSRRDDLPLLAVRMETSQADEIAQLERWLSQRDEEVPGHHQHAHHTELMPGMLTDAELAQLTAAEGARFDRLFLQYMIRHHEGAVVMVEELLAGGEGGQEPAVFHLARHIDADQRVEIARMRSLLAALPHSP